MTNGLPLSFGLRRGRTSAEVRRTVSPMRSVSIGGFSVRDTRTAPMIRFLRARMLRNEKIGIGFVNHHFVTSCQGLSGGGDGRPFLLLNDGVGMQVAALLRFGQGFRENMNGTDFVPRFLQEAEGNPTVYLLGGEREVVARAAAMISALPHCRVVGQCDGFSIWHREEAVLRDIEAQAPDILLVGFGNPLQERWILKHWDRLNAKVVFGVGALFEWMTGTRRRAPLLVRQLRLEWAYRLLTEPRRLLRRYTYDIVRFFSLVLTEVPTDPRQREAQR